jgi:hypothetical protein
VLLTKVPNVYSAEPGEASKIVEQSVDATDMPARSVSMLKTTVMANPLCSKTT